MAATVKSSKYDSSVKPFLKKIELWITKGATQKEIAKKLGITTSTLSLYLKKGREGQEPYSELSALFARAVEIPDDEVEAALFKLAKGYKETVQKAFKVRRAKFDPKTGRKIGEEEVIIQGPEEVYIPPNVEAQKFWLANRRKDRWSYKPEGSDSEAESDDSGVVMIPEIREATREG